MKTVSLSAAERTLSPPWSATRVARLALIAALISGGIWALTFIGFDPIELVRGLQKSGYLGRALPPTFDGEWSQTAHALLETFLAAVAGTGIAVRWCSPASSS